MMKEIICEGSGPYLHSSTSSSAKHIAPSHAKCTAGTEDA